MSKEWQWWLGEFGLATVVAVISGLVTKDIPISVLYGLFVGTVFFILREHRRVGSQFERHVAELEDKALNLPVTLKHKEDMNPFLKQIASSTRDEALRLAKEAVDGEMVLHSRPLANIIIEMMKLARPGDKTFGTNYGVMFDTPQGAIARQQQFDLAEKGVDITRVFIEAVTATPEEKKRLRQEMDRQKGHLNVRFVKESLLPPEARKNMTLIYDKIFGWGTYMKTVSTGRGQLVDEIRLYTRREELEKAKELAETVIRLSEEYK